MKMNYKKILGTLGATTLCFYGFAAGNEKGIEYYRAELYDAAKIFFNQQTNLSPADQAENYYYQGQVHAATQKVDSAAYFYQKAIQTDPEYPFSYIGEGKLALKNNNQQAASDLFKKAIGFAKKNPEIHTAVAEAYIDVKQYDKANEVLDKARSIKKDFSGIYVAEGDMLMAQSKTGDACAKYENAILFDKNDKVAYLKEVRVYKGINPEMALEILDRLLKIDSDYTPAYAELGEINYNLGYYGKAIEAYKKIMQIPGAPISHQIKYASLLYFTKDYLQSQIEIDKVLAKDPNNEVMHRLQAYNNFELGNYHLGLEQMEKFVRTATPKDLIAQDYVYYGRLADKEKNSALALENFKKALELDPSKSDIYKDLAAAYELQENFPEAISAYQKYIDSDKNVQLVDIHNFGVLCYSAGTQALGDNTASAVALDSIQKRQYLLKADTLFAEVAERSPTTYLGYFWRARANSAMDLEVTQGLAKPFYEEAVVKLEATNEGGRRNNQLLECYRYLGYYYLVKDDKAMSKTYWQKILDIDPANDVAKQAMEGLK